MSLNGWGGKLHAAVMDYLQQVKPDVLCLQEVVHTPSSDKEWLTYRDCEHVLPQRANFFHDVARVLPDHVALFCPAAQGDLWDGEHAVPSQWGLASFVHNSFPLIGQAQGFVHKQFTANGFGDHPRSRTAHAFKIFDFEANRPVCVTHMHGLRDPAGKMDTPEREAQIKRLYSFADHVSEPAAIQVICGDFNVEPESFTLKYLSDRGFTELVRHYGFEGTRTSHYSKFGRFADYMLINKREQVRSFDVVRDPEVSDHCPLLLEI